MILIPEYITPILSIPSLIPDGILPRSHFAYCLPKKRCSTRLQSLSDAARPLTPPWLPRTVGPQAAAAILYVPVLK